MKVGNRVKKVLGLLGTTLVIAGPAMAADVAAPAPAFTWTGIYIGGYGGYGWGHSGVTGTLDPNSGFGWSGTNTQPAYNATLSPGLRPGGFTGGGTIGANWQAGVFVLGLEGDFGAFNLSDAVTAAVRPQSHAALTSNTTVRADWLATVRGRIGWAAGQWLPYVTAGAAFANSSFKQVNSYAIESSGGIENFSAANLRVGWVAGAGLEYAFTPNWSAKIEYLHLDFGTSAATGIIPVQSVNVSHAADFTSDVVRAGINYKF
jgi:outer membrane immunogenic protein